LTEAGKPKNKQKKKKTRILLLFFFWLNAAQVILRKIFVSFHFWFLCTTILIEMISAWHSIPKPETTPGLWYVKVHFVVTGLLNFMQLATCDAAGVRKTPKLIMVIASLFCHSIVFLSILFGVGLWDSDSAGSVAMLQRLGWVGNYWFAFLFYFFFFFFLVFPPGRYPKSHTNALL
jgi:hypothetical protein